MYLGLPNRNRIEVEAYVRKLNDCPVRPDGEYVLYWIRAARRAESNPALVFAAELANSLGLPVLAFESLAGSDPYGNDRYQTFLLQGAAELAAGLGKLGIGYTHEDPFGRAAAVVTDDWPTALSQDNPAALDVQCYAVDSSCIVPHTAIPGRAYAAYSIRPKIHRLLPRFLKPVPPVRVERAFPRRRRNPGPFIGGAGAESFPEAAGPPYGCLRRFLKERLSRYSAAKNEPSAHATSDLSPYLHFGYISALEVALAVRDYASEHKLMADEFLEELIVRRELAFNFARSRRERGYRSTSCPSGPRATLARAPPGSARPGLYAASSSNSAATHDDLWNATQKELLLRGKIHGYYRMYWGKKIIEWSRDPRGGARHDDPPARPLRARRPRPEYLRQHSLVLRAARPPVAGAPDLRNRALHVARRVWTARPMSPPISARSRSWISREDHHLGGLRIHRAAVCRTALAGHADVRSRRDHPPDGELRLGPEPALPADACADAVIHLAGEPVAQRWTAGSQAAHSGEPRAGNPAAWWRRWRRLPKRPQTLVCASAIGYYGARGDEILTESSAPGKGFLAEVCIAWEKAGARPPKRSACAW